MVACLVAFLFWIMKNKLIVSATTAFTMLGAMVILANQAFADSFTFTLPSSTQADLQANAGGVISSVWVLVAIAIGIPLGFYILRKVIGLIPKK